MKENFIKLAAMFYVAFCFNITTALADVEFDPARNRDRTDVSHAECSLIASWEELNVLQNSNPQMCQKDTYEVYGCLFWLVDGSFETGRESYLATDIVPCWTLLAVAPSVEYGLSIGD